MALLDQIQQPPAIPQVTPNAQQNTPPMDGAPQEPQAGPEEQKQYDLMVSNAMEFIYGDKTSDTVVKMLSQGPPAQSIANVVSMIGAGLKKAADNVGKTVDSEAMLGAATEVIDHLIELGQAAGVFQFQSQEQVNQTATQALMIATKQFGQGLLDTQDGQAMQAQAQNFVQSQVRQENQMPRQGLLQSAVNQAQQSPLPVSQGPQL